MIIFNDEDFRIDEKTAVTLGNFDGFHMGHRRLFEAAAKTGLKSVVFTFSPHPVSFFKPKADFKTIYTEEEKAEIAEGLGADYFVNYPFTAEFAALSPAEFVRLLVKKTNCAHLAVGENYTFGKNKAGNAEVLKEIGAELGVCVTVVPKVKYEGERVSSTRIRECLKNGEIEKANVLLAKPYFLRGRVEKGENRGSKMGFPTANVGVAEEKLLPKDGVYATISEVGGRAYPSVTNIGKNPTFCGSKRTVETYIFDYEGDLYGKEICVGFRSRIRGEIRFSDEEELMTQIERDVERAYEVLGS